ncbi:MAG: hypothetical protein R3E64_04670 [Halioglobus sp.]
MDRRNHSPARQLLSATLALVASALLLLAGLAVYVEYGQRDAASSAEPLAIPGRKMQVVFGSGQIVGETLAITGYHPRDDELIAIAVRRGHFLADDFPLLRYALDADLSGPRVDLIWRLASDPATVKSVTLSDTDGNSQWLNLARSPDWHGEVLEIGVYVIANAADQRLSIGHLTLEPQSLRGTLCSHWADWTAYRGWSVPSINFLYGSVDRAALSPVEAAAAWSTLALVLLLVVSFFSGVVHRVALLAVVLLPWIALDLLWQHELESQLARTRDQFAGKSEHEKHLADIDGPIYRYIQRLKQQVLPEQVSRIVILHKSYDHNFERLKAQYYLLPNNVYNFGRVPPDGGMDRVDYVLVLGDVPDIQYREDANALMWKRGKRSLRVALVDSDPLGRLFRVMPSDSLQKGSR